MDYFYNPPIPSSLIKKKTQGVKDSRPPLFRSKTTPGKMKMSTSSLSRLLLLGLAIWDTKATSEYTSCSVYTILSSIDFSSMVSSSSLLPGHSSIDAADYHR
jgi:hypothetical protein